MLLYRGTCDFGAITILLSLLEPLSRGLVLHEGRETIFVGAIKILMSLLELLPQGRVLHEGRGICVVVAV